MEPPDLLMLWQMRLWTFWMEASVLPNNKFCCVDGSSRLTMVAHLCVWFN